MAASATEVLAFVLITIINTSLHRLWKANTTKQIQICTRSLIMIFTIAVFIMPSRHRLSQSLLPVVPKCLHRHLPICLFLRSMPPTSSPS